MAGCWPIWADVIKIEPPAGDPAPFAGDITGPERSLSFLNFNTNKRSAILDLETPEGRRRFLGLVRCADVVVEAHPSGYLGSLGLGYSGLSALNRAIVLTSITPFGQVGAWHAMPLRGHWLAKVTGLPVRPAGMDTLTRPIAVSCPMQQRARNAVGKNGQEELKHDYNRVDP